MSLEVPLRLNLERKGRSPIYFLQISDTHHLVDHKSNKDNFRQSLIKMTALSKKIQHLADSLDKPLDFICHCGDICHHGNADDYQQVKDYFQQYFPQVPLVVTVGNHDSLEPMSQVFPHYSEKNFGYTYDMQDLQMISLNNRDDDSGSITEEHCQWILQQLEGGKNSILFTHHHFFPEQSPIPRAELHKSLQNIANHPQLLAILTGHTHYYFQSKFYSKPYFTVDAFSFQGVDSGNGYLQMKESSGYHLFSYENGVLTLEKRGDLGFKKDLGIVFF